MKTKTLTLFTKAGMALVISTLAITVLPSCKKSSSLTPAAKYKIPGASNSLPSSPVGTDISDNLEAYWTGSNLNYPLTNQDFDFSGNGNTATNGIGVSQGTDRNGYSNALVFNGSASTTVANNTKLNVGAHSFSISTWVYLIAYGSSGSTLLHNAYMSQGWHFGVNGSGYLTYSYNATTVPAQNAVHIPKNTWTHVVMTYSHPANTLVFYVNGALDTTYTGLSDPLVSSDSLLYIGSMSGTAKFLDGSLSDIRFYYGRVLAATDVATLYGAGTPASTGLLAYWPMTKTPDDLSPGDVNNGVKNSGVSGTIDRFDLSGGAYKFNGTTGYIDVPSTLALMLTNTDFTVNAWVNADNTSTSTNTILSKVQPGSHGGYYIDISAGPSGTGLLHYSPGATFPQAYSTSAVGGGWHMTTLVYSLSTGKLYIYLDGVLNNTIINFPFPAGGITADLFIGKNNPIVNPAEPFDGGMSDLRIYTQALSATDVTNLYDSLY